MAEHLPKTIDRAALERVIQRAAELHTAEREIGDNLTWDEVRSLGREVGIPERYLQQALLEEESRTPAAAARGLLNAAIGPVEVAAQRVVRGDRESVEATLIAWIEEEELLTIQRQQPGRIDWEPLGGLQAAIKRSSAAFRGRRSFMLAKASLVSAVFVQLEPGYCHVAMTASLRRERGTFLGFGFGFLSAGIAGTAILASLGALGAVVPIPVLGGAALGYAITRQYRPVTARAHLGLERALDHLERGAVKPAHQIPRRSQGVVELVANEIRKALQKP